MPKRKSKLAPEAQGVLAVVNGKPKEGKTTLALHLSRFSRRVIFIDPKTKENSGILIRDRESLAVFIKENKRERFYVTYHPEDDGKPDALAEDMEAICEALMDWGDVELERGNKDWELSIFIDEFYVYRKGAISNPKLVQLIRKRSKWGFNVYLITHRPVDVHPDYLCTVEYWATFRQTHPADIKRLSEHTDSEQIEGIRDLKTHHFAIWQGRDWHYYNAQYREVARIKA